MASENKKKMSPTNVTPLASVSAGRRHASSEPSRSASAPREELLVSAREFVRKAGEPIWSQISRSVEEQIVTGNLPSGTRLPTETQLAASFEVNRHTLRRALRELVRKGLITATPRRGTIVSRRRIPFAISDNPSFEDTIASAGGKSDIHLLRHSIGLAPKEMAEWLGIAERSKVVDLHFVRVANDIPFCLTTSWLPADRFERIGPIVERLGCLEKALSMLSVTEYKLYQTRITSQPAGPEEIQQLEIPQGASVLVADTLFVDDTKEPILATHNRFAADRIELLV